MATAPGLGLCSLGSFRRERLQEFLAEEMNRIIVKMA